MFWQADINDDDRIDPVDVDLFIETMNQAAEDCRDYRPRSASLISAAESISETMPGDMNQDGHIDWRDIDYFRMVLEYPKFFWNNHPELFDPVDINDDDSVDESDINDFVWLINTDVGN